MAISDADYIIQKDKTIIDAYKQIDSVSGKGVKVLFVCNLGGKIIGALTDGDCRRALIKGKSLDTKVSDVMLANFTYLKKNDYDINTIKKIKELGLQLVPQLNDDGTLYKVLDFTSNRSYIPVDAVLMAGGKGERLRPLTLDIPKPLLKVANKPIIDYNIENIQKNGIEHINVTVNYLKEQIEEHFSKPMNGTQVNCVREPEFYGTMGAVKLVKEWHNDTILLMNSDLFTNIDLEAFYLHFKEHKADLSVAAVPYNVDIPYGIFNIEGSHYITGIEEKPHRYYYANSGIYLFKRELVDLIPQNQVYHATDFISDLIKQKKSVIRFPIVGYWIDIGKPDDFKKVQEFAANLKRGNI